MTEKPVLVHTHFHRKRTGVTRSIENVFHFFGDKFDAFIYGYGVKGRKISSIKLLKLLFSNRSIVIHCHRNNEIMFILLFRFLSAKFRLVASRHAESEISWLTRLLLQKCDQVVALTKNMAQQLPFQADVVGHGVDTDIFKPGAGNLKNVFNQRKLITCAGRVRKAKGQRFLLETAAPLLKEFSEWGLLIIGKVDNEDFKKELEKITSKYAIEKQVYFIDETPDIVSYYQASHSVVVPSFTEGFSLVCAEAMACGCNVLASRGVGVHSEMIEDRENGYLFSIDEKSELQQLLSDLMTGKLKHLGKPARNHIEANWSAHIEAENLMQLYEKMIKPGENR